ncbi:hypothetical protein Z517_08997 [Fonsecaea pedrosoi CBS 271.37]|uniref:Uncharacterized protein n=1 Tax=Fonsecaea pedrosoi CBS 271.37 TaxID=1442368 RepID=A0A0D2G7E2_9EURO|nr:uncharacterized protein Z517_08997 [Fonsecaea pedrosoi CBS 271.37]KIW76553.1 hypothetical protein Z517_08997 [Fonsecaea pedrosoi CBS 271.37]
MGANNSTIDANLPIFSEQLGKITIKPLKPHPSSLRSSREANETAAASVGHSQDRVASDSPEILSPKAPSRPRRLPPVESRETVKSQAFQIDGWRIVDGSDEIYESIDTERTSYPHPTSFNSQIDAEYSDLDIKPSLAEIDEALAVYQEDSPLSHQKTGSNLPIVLDSPPARAKRSLSVSPAQKNKRRLLPTKRAVEIADQKCDTFGENEANPSEPQASTYRQAEFGFFNPFPHGFPLDEEDWLRPDPHPGSCLYQDSEDEDEGHWSKIISPANSGEGGTSEEQRTRLNELLSRHHQPKPKQKEIKEETSNIELDEEQKFLDLAREYMHRYQEEGAERSRQLREKALRRRGLLTNSERGSDSEYSRTISDTDVDHDNDSTIGLFSDEPRDLAQHSKNSESRERGDKSKTVQRTDVLAGARNPPNRMQSQPLSDDRDAKIGRDKSGAIPLGDDHLREAKRAIRPGLAAKGSVSTPPPSRQFIADDGNCRARRQNPLPERPDGSTIYPECNREQQLTATPEHHAPRHLKCNTEQQPQISATEISAIENETPLYLERNTVQQSQIGPSAENETYRTYPRPLSSHETDTAERGAINEEKRNPKPLTRPLSGLEALAAKRVTVSDSEGTSRPLDRVLSQPQKLPRKRDLVPPDPRATESQPSGEHTAPPSTLGPRRNQGLTLPKNFDQFSEEEKDVIVQHEIAKERKRDLDALGGVFWTFAQLRCFSDREITERTMQTETNELYDIGRFISLVIEQGKPGKMRRTRVQDIRDNIRRRVQKAAESLEEPSDVAVMTEMRRTFSQKHIDFINDETPKVQKEIDHWGGLRSERKSRRHSIRPRKHRKKERPSVRTEEKSGKKQVRFVEDETRAARDKRPMRRARAVDGRQAQSDNREEIINKLKAQLRFFETADQDEAAELQSQVAEIEAELERATQYRHDNDEESEEDDGADFVFGAGQNAQSASQGSAMDQSQYRESFTEKEQDIAEVKRLEDGRQRDSAPHGPSPGQQQRDPELLGQMRMKRSQAMQSQGFDLELLRQMQLRREQQLEALTDPTIIDRATAGESDSETELGSEDASDGDRGENDQVFRYTVWGVFRGVEIYKDADHYYFLKTYDAAKAQDKVREIVTGVHRYAASATGIEVSRVSMKTELKYELMEQHIALGDDETVQAKVWIERDLVDLGQKVFRAAKRQRAVKQAATFAVYWEKTITPVVRRDGETETEADRGRGSDELDDVFSEFAEDRAQAAAVAAAPVTIFIPQDEIEHFTTPILANRHAKAVYLEWHNTFLPGWQDEGYRRLEEESMEQYLETLGDWGLFVREESFERVEKGGGRGGRGGHGGQRRVEEKIRVWVKKIAVKGPGN